MDTRSPMQLSGSRPSAEIKDHPATEPERLQVALARLRANDSTFRILTLEHANIGDVEVDALCESLGSNTYLNTCILNHNRIDDNSLRNLCYAIAGNASLPIAVLSLDDNRITDAGMTALSAFLGADARLQALYLKNNRIGNLGAEKLTTAFLTNTQLSRLQLAGNQIDADYMRALAKQATHVQDFMPAQRMEAIALDIVPTETSRLLESSKRALFGRCRRCCVLL